MKHTILILMVLIVLSACSARPESGDTLPLLTPYSTNQMVTDTPEAKADDLTATSTPAATATPVIHIVSLNETVSTIARQYGFSIDAILAANPEISPRAMIVGDAVVIPQVDVNDAIVIDALLTEAIIFGPPYCALSGGGLWCSVMVENTADFDLADPVVKFSFLDGEGNTITEKNVPAVLRKLKSNDAIPAFLFLADFPIGYERVDVSIFSAQEVTLDSEVGAVVEEERDVQLDPHRALITGKLLVQGNGGGDPSILTIGAAAFDDAGNAVGVRRKEITVAKDESIDFSILVYSSGNEIVEIILYTEVN